MKRILSVLLLFMLTLALTACAKPDYDKFLDGVKGCFRFSGMINECEYDFKFDDSTNTVTIIVNMDQTDASFPVSESKYICDRVAEQAKKYHIEEYICRSEFYGPDGILVDSYTGTESESAARMERFEETLRKMNGAFDVSPDDPLAGTWIKDESSSFSIIWPDEFTYGDSGRIFASGDMFTYDGGESMHKYHLSPDGSRLIIENGSLGNVIYIHQD